jgi:hypothetical protein
MEFVGRNLGDIMHNQLNLCSHPEAHRKSVKKAVKTKEEK